jgi:hypothetical protein
VDVEVDDDGGAFVRVQKVEAAGIEPGASLLKRLPIHFVVSYSLGQKNFYKSSQDLNLGRSQGTCKVRRYQLGRDHITSST